MFSEESFNKALGRVRGLLAKADDAAATPAESATYRAKAEDLMRKYRIEEEQALAVDPQSLKPEMAKIDITTSRSEFLQQYASLFGRIAKYVGIRYRWTWGWAKDGTGCHTLLAQVVGYPSDIKFAELLYTSIRMTFSENLEPQVKPELSDAANIYRLRNSGLSRAQVALRLWKSDLKDGAAHGKVQKIYKEECERRGEDAAVNGRQMNAKTYREVFAESFVRRMYDRLRSAQEGADKLGGAVTLHGRAERVDAAFYDLFPEEKPQPVKKQDDAQPGQAKGRKQRKLKTWTQADEARWQRMNASPAAEAGTSAGRAAADAVKLDGTEPAARLDRYTDQERADTRDIWGAIGG